MKALAFFMAIAVMSTAFSKAYALDLNTELKQLAKVKRKDVIKHRMEVALSALKQSNTQVAAEQLDIVLADIESFYTDSEAAKKARSIWANEGRKTFKGEPYERAMAYYYRGITYLMQGDYDNAHASFKGGQLQDAMAEGHDQRTDFALLLAMQAWSAKLMGQHQLAQQSQEDLAFFRRDFDMPSPETHALVVVETGKGPRKIRDGVSGERLVFRRGKKFDDVYVSISAEQQEFQLRPIEDIYYQASTRGARAIDFLNRGKAVFKEGWSDNSSSVADIASNAAFFVRSVNHIREYDGMVNGVNVNLRAGNEVIQKLEYLSLASSLITVVSSKVKAKSDTRAWSNLPDHVHLGFVPKTFLAGKQSLPITLLDRTKTELETIDSTIYVAGDVSTMAWLKVH